MKTIGLIGAGHIGSQVARLAVAHGYDVVISNSRGPETLADARRRARAEGARGDGRRRGEGRRHRGCHVPLKNYRACRSSHSRGRS